MAWLPWVQMICGGAGTRLGSRRSVSVTHEWMGLGSSFKAPKRPSSSALLLGWLLFFIPPVSSVACPSCKDTIPGCKGGADCPLLKTPMENAAWGKKTPTWLTRRPARAGRFRSVLALCGLIRARAAAVVAAALGAEDVGARARRWWYRRLSRAQVLTGATLRSKKSLSRQQVIRMVCLPKSRWLRQRRRLLGCLPRPTGRWPLTVVLCRLQVSPMLPPRQRLWRLGQCTGSLRGWRRT